MSERETYLAAASAFADLVERVPTSSYDGPGLGEWDLRALVGHASRALVTVLTYLDQPGRTEEVEVRSAVAYYVSVAAVATDADAVAERGRAAGAALGDAPATRVRLLSEEVAAKLAGFDDDYVLVTIAGPMRLDDYLPTRTFELVVHGLDIARVASVEHPFGGDLLGHAARLAAEVAARTGRGADVLMALTGREPLPEGFSVV